MVLSISQFNALTKEGQQEYIYFTQSLHERQAELQGIKLGLQSTAMYLADVSECTNAMARIKVRKDWVKQQLESQPRYESIVEDIEMYEKRLEKILAMASIMNNVGL